VTPRTSAAGTLLDAFTERVRAVDGEVAVTPGVAAARDHISALCAQAGGDVVATLEGLEFAPAGAIGDADAQRIAGAGCGVSVARLGVAETGSVLLAPMSRRDRLVAVLPPLHIVVLHAATLCASLDDAAAQMSALLDGGGAYLTMVTGPSRTADIERVITVGAHGPRRLRVVVVEDQGA
jgi:L-lactate dehydrogenase complex protein LldG